ncbi:hypothetical protein CALCODRAFT_489120, partial [Calocera cornea HHB12733]
MVSNALSDGGDPDDDTLTDLENEPDEAEADPIQTPTSKKRPKASPSEDLPPAVVVTPNDRDKESQALLVEEAKKWKIGEGVFLIPRTDLGQPGNQFE